MALKKGTEIATIDVCLVTITTKGDSPVEIALKTSNQVQVSPATETTEAVKLIIKGELIAQKGEEVTITGNAGDLFLVFTHPYRGTVVRKKIG